MLPMGLARSPWIPSGLALNYIIAQVEWNLGLLVVLEPFNTPSPSCTYHQEWHCGLCHVLLHFSKHYSCSNFAPHAKSLLAAFPPLGFPSLLFFLHYNLTYTWFLTCDFFLQYNGVYII